MVFEWMPLALARERMSTLEHLPKNADSIKRPPKFTGYTRVVD